MTAFFFPDGPGKAGEDVYQRLRKETESRMGRPPSRRRIMEVWTRRGNLDCITKVGDPDPISGAIVTAIFDMGPHQPFIVYCQQAGHDARGVLRDHRLERLLGLGVHVVKPLNEIEEIHAEVNHYRDSVALLRARLYRRGIGTNPRLQELERRLESARLRLRAARSRALRPRDVRSSRSRSSAANVSRCGERRRRSRDRSSPPPAARSSSSPG